MKALAIVALVFAGISIFVPVVGVFLAMLCSILALITFKSQPTLSGITFGLNIISTAFLSPTLMVASANVTDGSSPTNLYFFYVGFHVVLFLLAVLIFFATKKKQKNTPQS